MIVVAGYIDIDPAGMDRAAPLVARVLEATRAEAGCVLYVISRSIDVPGRLHIHEEWESLEALAAHGEAPHLAAFRAELGEIGVKGHKVWRREAGEATTL